MAASFEDKIFDIETRYYVALDNLEDFREINQENPSQYFYDHILFLKGQVDAYEDCLRILKN